MYSACQGMANRFKSIFGSAFVCVFLSACGSGGSDTSSTTTTTEQPTPSQPNPQPSTGTLQIVPFDFQQRAENKQYRSNQVQKASFVNATGGFRLPIPEQNLTGNLTIAIDLEDPDGITSAYVGFNGSASAIQLCNQDCNGTTYQRTVTGVNPLDHGRTSGPLQLNLMVGDEQGNLTTVSTVSFFWQFTAITGFTVDRQAGAINLNWNGISNYLRYNVYTASQDGVTNENYQNMPDGEAILAVRDPQLVLSGKEDAKTFYATVTGVSGSGESAFGEVAKIVALAGSIDNPPTAVNDNYSMEEDTTLTQNLLDNDFDAESQTLTANTGLLRAPENGSVTLSSDGTFTYTPITDFHGRDSFRYQVIDGLQQVDTADVVITVNQGNDAPESFGNNYNLVGVTARNATAARTSARVPLTIDAPGLLINDLDIDNNSMSIITTPVSEPTQGILQLNSDGSFVYDANAGATGEDQFTYQSSDGNGGIAEATVRITINGDSFFPRAATDRYTLTEGDTFVADNSGADRLSILANDTDLDAGDVLTISTNLIRAPANGTINLAADGTFTYIPNAGYYGNDSFVYEISDQQNHTAQAGVIFTINRRNDPPIAANDTYTLEEDATLTLDATAGVMSNDSDVDFDPLSINSTPVQPPSNGQLTLASDGSFVYQPEANFFGSDSFTYRISDDSGASADGTVTLTVTNVNDPPVANDDTVLTSIDTAINIDVLQNDTDVENQTLTIVSATADAGTVSINADSTLTYTPPAGVEGNAQIDYSIDDGGGVTAAARVFVTISNTNQLPVAANDSYVLNEDVLLVVNGGAQALLIANDSDPEGNQLTVNTTPVNNVGNGTLTLFNDGSFNYQPNSNFNGTDQFVYQIDDGFGGTATATVSLTINAVNDPPVTNDDSIQTVEDTLININVLANDSDVDNDPLTITSATASNGSVAIVGDGTLNYTPGSNFVGADFIDYAVSDNNGASSTARVNITVFNVNDPPVAQNDSATTNESTPVTISVLSNDSDIDGDALSVLAANASSGSVAINADNTLTYTPNTGFNGSDTIDYTISDGNGASTGANVFVTVLSVNDNPVANNDVLSINEDNSGGINVLANDSDIDGDPLSVVSANAGFGSVSINNDNSLTYLPPLDFNGNDTIGYTISDGQGGSAQAQVFVTVAAVNDNPIANADNAVTNEDTLVFIDVLANDSDVDNNLASLTITAASALNGSVGINTDQTLSYQPNNNFNGNDTITYQISDGAGGSASSTVAVTVVAQNDAPIAGNDTATTDEDVATTINVLANDNDPDNDPLTVTSAQANSGNVSINGDGTLLYSPNENFNGNDVIAYVISDINGQTASATVSVTVNAVNDLPIAQNDNATTSEDIAIAIDVLANDSDVDSPNLTITSAVAQSGQVLINSGTSLQYTPNANFNGSDTINYSISDGNGGTAAAQVLVVVSGVNDLPVAQNDTATTDEDQAVVIDVLTNDTDADGDTLTITSAQGQNGQATVNANTLSYQPNANFNGSDTITYAISDNNGGVATASVAIIVNAVNDLPIAVNDSAVVNEDDQTNINVLANDNDVDEDTLTVTAATATSGTVVINADQTLTYTPNSNFNGTDSINYSIADGNGGTAQATVALSITATNDIPVANNDAATTSEDTPVNIDILSNDTDIDNDTLTITAASASAGSVVVTTNQQLSYTPNTNFNGTDTINYTISDGNGGTSSATVALTIEAVNDLPVAISDAATTAEDTVITIAALSNDSDVDGDTLSVATASASNGSIVITSASELEYTPNSNFNGVDTINYSVSDGQGGSAQASVVVTVTPVNDLPVAVNDSATTLEDTSVTINVLANDSDLDNDNLTVQSAAAQNAQVTINSDGTLAYVPNANFNGSDTITYSITDGQGGTAQASVVVTVTSVNDIPVAVADTASTDEDVQISLNVLSNDTDADGDTLTISAVNSSEGVVSIDSTNNTISYTPTDNFHGSVTIDYSISDGNGGSASSSVAVTVNPINDHPTIVADTHSTSEDTTSNIDPLANDSDVDGDILSITAATANNGTVTIKQAAAKSAGAVNSTHTLDYVPNANYNGSETITYTISDGNGGTGTSTIAVTIAPVNDLPIAVADTATTSEDIAVNINVLANDTDADGETLTVQSATATNGSVVINSDQTLTYTPNANFNGSDTINYTINDPANVTASSTVAVTITAVNDIPVAVADTSSLDEDSSTIIDVLANDTDADGDTLSLTTVSATNGNVSVNTDKTLSYVPNANFNGTDTINYQISDGNDGTASGTVSVTVVSINDNPIAISDTASGPEDTLLTVAAAANDTDVDGDTLTIKTATVPTGVGSVVVNSVNALEYTPAANYNGSTTISYTIDDGNGGSAIATVAVTITAVNDNPVATNDSVSTNEDTLVNVAVLSNDSDVDNDTLTVVSATATNGSAVIVSDTTINYTPNANFNGSDTLTYNISDGNGGTATANVAITINAVNDAPVANADTATTSEDTLANINVIANDTDVEVDSLTVTAATASNGNVVVQSDQSLNYTPNTDYNGSDTINYTISDGNGGTSQSTVAVTITAVNDNPVAVNDTATTDEDNAVTIAAVSNDSDVDGDTLSIDRASANNGSAAISNNQNIVYTPTANFNGTTTIEYSIIDGNGGTATAIVTVTVNAVNDVPVANADTFTATEDTLANINVLSNDTDVDGDTLTVTSATSPKGNIVIQSNQTLNYTPNTNEVGTDTIIYAISDGNGGTAQSTVNVTISAVNDNPVAVNDTATTNEDTLVNIKVLDNDSDPEGNTLSVTGANATNGIVSFSSGSTIDYTPNADYNGSDTINYTISDGVGGTATATVAITVTAVNDNPVAVNDSKNTSEDTPVNITVLANDTDVEGDTLTITAASASNGDASFSSGSSIDYTPNANYNGSDTINYTISDGNGGTANGTVTVTIAAVNDDPVASNDTATTNEDTLKNINVLSNDSDADGDLLDITNATASNGVLTIKSDQTLDYVPNVNFNGSDTINYTISDNKGGTATASVAVTVTAINDAPTYEDKTGSIAENSAVGTTVMTMTGSDVDTGDTLTYSIQTNSQGIFAINSATGVISVADNSGLNYESAVRHDIVVKVTDSGSISATANATINVTNVEETVTPTLDTTFGTSGTGGANSFASDNYDVVNDAVIDSNGKTVITGYVNYSNSDLYIARFNSDGTIDRTFGYRGAINKDLGQDDKGVAIAVDSSGRVVVAGTQTSGSLSEVFVIRYTATGMLDTTFNTTGYAVTSFGIPFSATDMKIASDGSILVSASGIGDFRLIKFASDGTSNTYIDVDFSSGSDIAYSLALQSDGKALVAGAATPTPAFNAVGSDFAVARFNVSPSLSLDTTYGSSGKVAVDIGTFSSDVAYATYINAADELYVAGATLNTSSKNDTAAIKLDSSGNLVSGFGSSGKLVVDVNSDATKGDEAKSIAADSSGNLYFGVESTVSNVDAVIYKTDATGAVDSSYGASGQVSFDYSSSNNHVGKLLVDSSNRVNIAVNGTASAEESSIVARYTTAGALDTSYHNDGFNLLDATFSIDAMVNMIELQASANAGKFVAVGSAYPNKLIVARFTATGAIDETFGVNGFYTLSHSEGSYAGFDVAELSDGRLVVTGAQDSFGLVLMLTADGALDSSFGSSGMVGIIGGGPGGLSITAVTIDKNNKIVIGGSNVNISSVDLYVARLNLDGSFDTDTDSDTGLFFTSAGYTTFDLGVDESISGITTLSDGSVLAVGGKGGNGFIVKLLENGSRDTSGFAAPDGYKSIDLDPIASTEFGVLTKVKVKSDGKIVASGFYTEASSTNVVVQLNADGSLDTTFDTDGIVSHNYGTGASQTLGLGFDSQERIIVAGGNYNGTNEDIFVARITETGTKDALFNTTGGKLFDYGGDEYVHALIVLSDGSLVVGGGDDLNLFPTPFFFIQKIKLVEP